MKGILEYLSGASVVEVKRFRNVGDSVHGTNKPLVLANAIGELLMAMYPRLYHEAACKNTDKRPLEKFAIALVPACSLDFIRDLITQDSKS
jgi:hypothetical protein